MPRILLALLFWCAALGAAPAQAEPDWTVTVDPLTTALGFAHVQVERVLAPGFSVYAGPHLRLYDSIFSKESEDFIGLGVEVGGRWFFAKSAPAGLWVGARGVLASLSTDVSGQRERAPGGYVSALLGYTWVLRDRIVLSGGAGVQYLQYQIAGLGPEGVLPALHTTLGIAF